MVRWSKILYEFGLVNSIKEGYRAIQAGAFDVGNRTILSDFVSPEIVTAKYCILDCKLGKRMFFGILFERGNTQLIQDKIPEIDLAPAKCERCGKNGWANFPCEHTICEECNG